MKPEIRTLEPLRLQGLVRNYTVGSARDIPIQWGEFLPGMAARVDPRKHPCFGISDWRSERSPDRLFEYWTAFEVPPDCPELPSTWNEVEIPGCRVAVFVHQGSVATFPATYQEVRGPGLDAAGLTRAHDFDIEFYAPGYDPDAEDGEIEIWIPVEAD